MNSGIFPKKISAVSSPEASWILSYGHMAMNFRPEFRASSQLAGSGVVREDLGQHEQGHVRVVPVPSVGGEGRQIGVRHLAFLHLVVQAVLEFCGTNRAIA